MTMLARARVNFDVDFYEYRHCNANIPCDGTLAMHRRSQHPSAETIRQRGSTAATTQCNASKRRRHCVRIRCTRYYTIFNDYGSNGAVTTTAPANSSSGLDDCEANRGIYKQCTQQRSTHITRVRPHVLACVRTQNIHKMFVCGLRLHIGTC